MLIFKAGKQSVTRLAFSADGTWLAAGGTGWKVYLWNLTAQTMKASTFTITSDSVAWLGFLPDNKVLVLEQYGKYRTHDPATRNTVKADLRQGRWVGQVVATADRSVFYGTGNEAQRWDFDGHLHEVWNFRVPDTKTDTVTGRGGVVIPPNGTVVAAVSNGRDKTWLHIRDAATGKLRSKRLVARAIVRDLTLFPDGKGLAFVCENGERDTAPNTIVAGAIGKRFTDVVVSEPNGARFTALAAHPSGQRVAVGQSDGVVRTFDSRTWAELSAHQWDTKPVNCVVFAPDGLKAAAAFDGTGQFVVWDVDL